MPERANDTSSSTDDHDSDDVTRLWRIVDELTAELSDSDCRSVYTAIATGVADGWRPTDTEIASLVTFAKQQAAAAQHQRDPLEMVTNPDARYRQ